MSGTVDITSASYLANSGTVRVGAHSTAVEITGTAAHDQGLHFFNAGTIDASQASSTAIRLNADNRLDSYVVNVGTIAGNVTFGRGDDRLMNTLMIDNAGAGDELRQHHHERLGHRLRRGRQSLSTTTAARSRSPAVTT